MSNDLARARVRKAADDWLAGQEYQVPLPPKRIGLTPDSFRTFMLEAFVAGASYSEDEHTITVATGQRQLDTATALMTEAVSMLRETEALHRRHAASAGATPGPESMAERNALMAERLSAWLRGEEFFPVKPGTLSPADQAVQEEFVSAALAAGIDQISEADEPGIENCRQRFENVENFSGFVPGGVVTKGPSDSIPAILQRGEERRPHPLVWDGRSSTLENEQALGVAEFARRNPANVLRDIGEEMVDGVTIKGVDHASFDRAAEYLDQPVEISAIAAPPLADAELTMLKERRDATLTPIERDRNAACAEQGFVPWFGGDGPPADLDRDKDVLLDWGEEDGYPWPRFGPCPVKELTPEPGLWGERDPLNGQATIIGYRATDKVIEHPEPISTERVRVPGVITESRQEIRYEIEGEEGLDLTKPIWINGVPYMPARQYEAASMLAKAETLLGEASEFIRGVTGANPGSDSEEMCQRLDAWPLSLATPAAPTAEEN